MPASSNKLKASGSYIKVYNKEINFMVKTIFMRKTKRDYISNTYLTCIIAQSKNEKIKNLIVLLVKVTKKSMVHLILIIKILLKKILLKLQIHKKITLYGLMNLERNFLDILMKVMQKKIS